MQMNNLKTSGHAVYAIQSHIVFVTKYRHKCITQQMIVSIKSQIQETCKKWRSELLEFNGESDHVHLLISSHPTVALSDLVANLKTVTSRRLRKDYEQHLRQYSGNRFFGRHHTQCLVLEQQIWRQLSSTSETKKVRLANPPPGCGGMREYIIKSIFITFLACPKVYSTIFFTIHSLPSKR